MNPNQDQPHKDQTQNQSMQEPNATTVGESSPTPATPASPVTPDPIEPQQSPTAPPPPPTQPTNVPAGDPGQPEAKPFNKSIIFVIVAVLITIILALLYFFALNTQQPESNNTQISPAPTMTIPTTEPTPEEEITEEDIDIIDLGDPESELEIIEEELNNL